MKYNSRKFLITLLIILVTTVLLYGRFIGEYIFADIIKFVLAGYMIGNVGEYMTNKTNINIGGK